MPIPSPAEQYRQWLNDRANALRAGDAPPAAPADCRKRAERIRGRVRAAEGDAFMREKCPLSPEMLGTLERDGYRVEKLAFQTRPGCFATATAYVPTLSKGPFPAVLNPHGHWAGARRDPVVQSRSIGLAKLGFFALTLDAWGAGERGTRPGVNEYHGGLLGASLWPIGTPLHGLQLWDNIRALDYIQSRPEVDGKRIGCTGASGGGNQTTQISAFDPRITCAVPVCSVGTFASYLDTACCVDEVLNGALAFAEEGDLLGLVAPGALLVITASRDTFHFGPVAAGQALDRAKTYFKAHGAEERVRHAVFESGHDYSRPMREAMYGWMTRWLKHEGDGSPIPEPEFKTEDVETLRCFPPDKRPAKVMTTVRWVSEHTKRLAEDAWKAGDGSVRRRLQELVAGELDSPDKAVPAPISRTRQPAKPSGKTVVLAHPVSMEAAMSTRTAERLAEGGVRLVALELPGCGSLALPGQGLGADVPDHNLVEWSLWTNRPLLGQWVAAIRRSVGECHRSESAGRVAVLGWREAGLAALIAAALDLGIAGAATVETLATFTGDGPPHNQRMALFHPDLLKAGDIPRIAALAAPRPVLLANPVLLNGMAAPAEEVRRLTAAAHEHYAKSGHPDRFTARASLSDGEIADVALAWLA